MRIPLQVSMLLRYLHQEKGETLKHLQEMYPQFKKTTIFRHMKKPLNETAEKKLVCRSGRPAKVTDRDRRHIISTVQRLYDVEERWDFTSKMLRELAGVTHLSPRTVRRVLNEEGFKFKQCRKKGLLLKEDLDKRLKFAKRCKKLPDNFWKEGVSFYLDGVSFVHKTNPDKHARTSRTRMWMRKGDGLKRHCTAKGKKEGVSGRYARFMCAISYGHGFIECFHYTGSLDGEKCKELIKKRFPLLFRESSNPKGKLFLQDGDPSQNSSAAREGMNEIGCRLFKIPPRSPDLNPIENAFHNIRKRLAQESIDQNIVKESYSQFCQRVRRTILNYDKDVIDRTIESMPKRINLVIKNKGIRTKY